MIRGVARFALVVLTFVGCGCGGDDGLRTLGPEDVGPIAPGTAVGTLFSGDYLVTSGRIDACRCRVGICASLSVTLGDVVTATQSGGALELFFASTQDSISGAIDADGAFRCSGANQTTTGVGYALIRGQFSSANSVPTSVSLNDEVTLATITADCDIKAHRTAQFLQAAAASQGDGAQLAADGRAAGFLGVGLQ